MLHISEIKGRTSPLLLLATTRAVLLSLGIMSSSQTWAYDEIQVYNWAINNPGQFGLEMHSNYVIDGTKYPSYRGELPPNHLLAFTPEFSYGVTKHFELGLYLPFSVDVNRNISYMDDAKVRAKWLNADDQDFYYGLNVEVGREPRRYAEDKWNAELRPIIGGTLGDWLIAFNPDFEFSLSGKSQKPEFAPQIKVMYRLEGQTSIGVEHYSSLGTLDRISAIDRQSHTTYLVTDFNLGSINVNLGIGRGWTSPADAWTLKVIFGGIPFMDAFKLLQP